MKKFFLVAIICLVCLGTTQAQYKPEGVSLTTELQFTPVQVANGQVFNNDMAFRGRLFVADNMAIRLTFGYGLTSDKEVNYNFQGKEKAYETTKTQFSQFTIAPGFEYHFNGAERLSPYIGAEVGVGFGTQKETIDNSINSDNSFIKASGFGFNVNAVAGVDFYIYKGLYLGAEISLGYGSIKIGSPTTKVSINGVTTTIENDDYTKSSNIGFNCEPAIRLGWKF